MWWPHTVHTQNSGILTTHHLLLLDQKQLNTLPLGHAEMPWLLAHVFLTGHAYLHFLTRHPAHAFVSGSGSLIASRLLTTWCRMLGTQVTNKQTLSLSFPSVAIMPLCRNFLQEDNILCELYADTCPDLSDYRDNESLDSDSDVPTTSSHKQLRSSTGPLTPQFWHPFFLTSIKTIFITVWD